MKKLMATLTAFCCFCMTGALFAQEATPAKPKDGSYWQMLIMIAIAIAFFYLIVLRPEKKRRKAMQERRNAMKKGDRVTAMGIIGNIHQIKDETVILRLYDGAKMEILKAAISDVQPATEEEARRADKEGGGDSSKRVEFTKE